ncbi:peptidoglycan DD-metalloendopeptidase family protein [Comamonas humi]
MVAAVLAGCGSTSLNRAPVEDRGSSVGQNGSTATAPTTPPKVDPATLPGAENAGKPGYYTVKPGETLMRIATDHGQNWRDIARWSNLENPNVIEVGQVLRVVPPAGSAPPPAAVATAPAAPAVTGSAATAPAPSTPAPSAPETPASASDNLGFIWPSPGSLIAGFDESRNKGLDIAGKAGDPVVAAADGRVIYAGAGLRGYGNLILIKHNNTFLTAYAHNQALLVKDDQVVRKGQKIAEMGSSDADRVKLHFEIRRQGKPVDPARYLPSR